MERLHTISRRAVLGTGMAAMASAAFGGDYVYETPPQPGETLRADIDDSRRIVAAPRPGYWPFRGISGAGTSVTDETAHGGWVSGLPGVRYKGPNVPNYPTAPWDDADSGQAVKDGLLPPIRPIWNTHIRDTIIRLGGDGFYYMTGSTGDNIWACNDGVEIWRSPDLKDWTYLGLVWSIERDGTWEKNWTVRRGVYFRAIWAPELHYLAGNYFICTSISGVGIGILKSVSGKAEGPYVHCVQTDGPIKGSIDATLFEDTDGRIYLSFGSAETIREIKRDFSGFAGDWQKIVYDVPAIERKGKFFKRIGFEGATLFKRNGLYYIGACEHIGGRYSFAYAVSETITGPYRMAHEGVPCCGGGNVFVDKQGRWWQTFFGNDMYCPFREKPSLVRIDFDAEGKVVAHKDQPFAQPA